MTQNDNKKNSNGLVDTRIDVKIIIAALWISHFLLWTFGDMVSLLQDMNGPVANELLMFVAVPLALTQVSMILISLTGKPRVIRWASFCIAPVFILLNIGFLSEARFGWEFVLGTGYIAINTLILAYAWKWPRGNMKTRGGF